MTKERKIITLAAWRRPDYFNQVISSLRNAKNISDYTIICSIDGGYPEEQIKMYEILKSTKLNFNLTVHEENLGCAENTRWVLEKGFSLADKVIHLEDDTIIHPQGLLWFEHNLERYEHDERIFSITGYTNGKMNDLCLDGDWAENHVVGIRDWFSCWGWATWKRVWDELSDSWFGIDWKDGVGISHEGRQSRGEEFLKHINRNKKGSWGIPMNHYWRKNRFEICPHTSFIQNIGVDNSTWATEEVHKFKQFTDWFRPNIAVNMDWEHFFVEEFLEGLE